MTLSKRALTLGLVAVAFVVAAVAIVRWLTAPPPVPDFIVATPVEVPREAPTAEPDLFKEATVGGTYAGTVVGPQDKPIRDADVFLVGVDSDAHATVESYDADGNGQTIELPIFGEYKTAARGRTDESGRFSLAAGSARIVAIIAYATEYAPGMVAHTKQQPLQPGLTHVVRLARAGWFQGHVLDKATNEPVAGADVAIYLQHPANQADQEKPGAAPLTPTNAFSVFQSYVSRELGPLVWGRNPRPGDNAFHEKTSADGRFRFGPLMKEVQVEVIITHPKYMWTEFDAPVGVETTDFSGAPTTRDVIRRTVVPPGETVERMYLLERGREVSGTVVDSNNKPIADVVIALEHVAQYAQHHRYRTTARFAQTGPDGKFKIEGLSLPPYNLRMSHPSFDTEWISGVKEGSDSVYRIETAGGWIELTVEDGPPNTAQWSARIWIEAADRRTPKRDEPVMVRDGKALIERVKPGKYDVFLSSGTKVSTTARVDVVADAGASASVRLEAGGGIELSVRDSSGNPVDPVSVDLYEVSGQEGPRRSAMLIGRQGLVSTQSLLPGRYFAEVRGLGFLATKSEPFDVRVGAVTRLPGIVVRRQAFVRITNVVGDDGRGLPTNVDVAVYVADGGQDFSPRRTLESGLLPVTPGDVMLKAESTDGRRFTKTIHPADGETVPVEIRLAR